jgi:tRNA (cmo5U34)-methyltransferase
VQREEIKAIFDQQAQGYDRQWEKMAPIRDCLHYLLRPVFAGLPGNARILCVGVGTGIELGYLAATFPGWRFSAVDPSGAMLEVCRQRARSEGFESRCDFHEGYVDSLAQRELHDGATCFLVSQFLMEREARTDLFRAIAHRLRPGALLVSSDLASDVDSPAYEALLSKWITMMSSGEAQPGMLERIRAAYARDVAVLPPAVVESIIASAGFRSPVQFYQAGLIHAWFSERA